VFQHAEDLKTEYEEEEHNEHKTKWFAFDWHTIAANENGYRCHVHLQHEIENYPNYVYHPESETSVISQLD